MLQQLAQMNQGEVLVGLTLAFGPCRELACVWLLGVSGTVQLTVIPSPIKERRQSHEMPVSPETEAL